MEIKMRPRKFRQIVITVFVTMAIVFGLGYIFIARAFADNNGPTPYESSLIANGAGDAVCAFLHDVGVTTVALDSMVHTLVQNANLPFDRAATVIAYSVMWHCPQYVNPILNLKTGIIA